MSMSYRPVESPSHDHVAIMGYGSCPGVLGATTETVYLSEASGDQSDWTQLAPWGDYHSCRTHWLGDAALTVNGTHHNSDMPSFFRLQRWGGVTIGWNIGETGLTPLAATASPDNGHTAFCLTFRYGGHAIESIALSPDMGNQSQWVGLAPPGAYVAYKATWRSETELSIRCLHASQEQPSFFRFREVHGVRILWEIPEVIVRRDDPVFSPDRKHFVFRASLPAYANIWGYEFGPVDTMIIGTSISDQATWLQPTEWDSYDGWQFHWIDNSTVVVTCVAHGRPPTHFRMLDYDGVKLDWRVTSLN